MTTKRTRTRARTVSERTLRQRLYRFLRSGARGGPDVAGLLDYLKPAGEVILFGGVLRDLALEGGRVYPSDIDVVVRTTDKERLGALIRPHRARTNKFGGYRFSVGRWNFDV